MSRNDWFEEFLRARISRESHAFDTEQAWNRLQQRRRKRKPRLAILLWCCGLLIAGAGFRQWILRDAPATQVFRPAGGEHAAAEYSHAHAKEPAKPFAGTQRPEQATVNSTALENAVAETGFKNIVNHIETAHHSIAGKPDLQYNISSAGISGAAVVEVPEVTTNELPEKTERQGFMMPPSISLLPSITPPGAQPEKQAPPFFEFEDKNTAAFRKRRKRSRWQAGVTLGYGLQRVDRASGNSAWLAGRDDEEALDAISAGLLVRRHIGDRWFLQSGVNWLRLTDRRRFSSESTTTASQPNQLVQVIVHADGSEEKVFGDAPVTTVTRTEGVRYNRYERLELPLLAGVDILPGLSASAGLAWGIWSRSSGYVAGPDPGQETPVSELGYRKGGLVSGLLQIEYSLPLPGGALGLGLQGRKDLLNNAGRDAGFEERRGALGIAISYRRMLR
ncbi:MAG: hypothetical protein H6575_19460 [Lewinellaceae bacterium]|nr:hypothetical protein [Lewinellaceae bacterium]